MSHTSESQENSPKAGSAPPPQDEKSAAEVEALSPRAKSALKIMFLTLFIDLAGFSIIFPLFPSMLQHYQATEAEGSLFMLLYDALLRFSTFAGAPDLHWGVLVLFGGALGSVYSLLQFFFAPILGAWSDRVGRRPILLLALGGLALSYLLWFFAGSFALLLIARVLGGMMSANISTASAVVADVTTQRTRSKGMAIIGMAFGLGFIFGPVIGGVSSLIDLTAHWPGLAAYGVNPFSMAAAVAFLLSIVNLLLVWRCFPETHQPGVTSERIARPLNPVTLFQAPDYPGVRRTNTVYFLFLLAFSGMEFTLTFLAVERLGYTPRENALMFLFVGVVLAGMQGSYVRRRSGSIGPRRMAQHGLVTLIPGLLLLALAGYTQMNSILYSGLFLLAVGAAQAIPCLTALVSMYTPSHAQGSTLGIFRSLGALSRALGPLFACLLYWRLGASTAYVIGAAFILVPLLIARRFPEIAEHNETGAVEDQQPAEQRA